MQKLILSIPSNLRQYNQANPRPPCRQGEHANEAWKISAQHLAMHRQKLLTMSLRASEGGHRSPSI